MLKEYSHIRAYHACKPIKAGDYFSKGILIAKHEELKGRAKQIFCSDGLLAVSESEVQNAAEKLSLIDNKKLYLAIDDRFLLENCGHYLIYGSEYILAIANNLPTKQRKLCIERILKIGKPTIFEISLPLKFLNKSLLSELACRLCRSVYNHEKGHHIDFALTLNESISPELIVGSYHPSIIEDPYNSFQKYSWT